MTGLLMAATKPDLAVFIACAIIIISGALGVVLSKNPVHSALMLVMTLFGVAVAFVAQEAHFLAAVQVIVYAGAIVVLFLFVIMLIGVDEDEHIWRDTLKVQKPLAVLLGLIMLGEVLLLSRTTWATGARSTVGPNDGDKSNIALLADQLFTRYLIAFEVTSALLIIAVIGAVVLSRRQPSHSEPQDAEARPERLTGGVE